MKRGKYIVFEGISGTGKETQAKLLKKFLATKHIKSVIVFHPTAGIKPILRQQKTVTDQLRVLAADRAGVVNDVILPALKRGQWVISLRNYISAYVYQGNGQLLKTIDPEPDELFYFDLTPEIAMKRIESRGELRGLYEKISLLRDKRNLYKNILKTTRHITVDASEDIQTIHTHIVKRINPLIQ